MDWQDLNVAFTVSQEGTVSGAAKVLGVHHATVIRHVDRLEEVLGQKLFRRHAKGYEPTEAGQALFNVAAVAGEQFDQAKARLENREGEISGKIVITTLPLIGEFFMPAFKAFQDQYPNVRIRLETSRRLYRLEFGEAHIALRGGEKPTDPDNIPIHLADISMGLYASQSYTETHGIFDGSNGQDHVFVGSTESFGPFNQWLKDQGLREKIMFDSLEPAVDRQAILSGMGLGFLGADWAKDQPNLVQHLSPRDQWQIKIWQVTHRDMHRTAKVQAMSKCLREFTSQL